MEPDGRQVPSFAARPKLGAEVTRYLREAIITGDFTEGERLRVDELAGRLQVSTMPVREALVALANEGMIELLPRRGYRVSSGRSIDLPGVFEVHAFTAGLLAARAAEVVTDEQIAALEEIQAQVTRVAGQRMSLRQRIAAIEDLNFSFHRTINLLPDAIGLRWFLRAASRYVPRGFYNVLEEDLVEATVHEHPPIIKALAGHNSREARKLMEAHIRHAGQAVLKHLEEKSQQVSPG
jgi:DNA-binding GntR family transcriptional regulator